jgi:hypothetical protein
MPFRRPHEYVISNDLCVFCIDLYDCFESADFHTPQMPFRRPHEQLIWSQADYHTYSVPFRRPHECFVCVLCLIYFDYICYDFYIFLSGSSRLDTVKFPSWLKGFLLMVILLQV